MCWTSLSSIRGSCSPIGGEQKEGPQPEEPKNDKARSLFERHAETSLGKSERLSVKLGGKGGMGHDDRFPSLRPSDRRQFCQEIFARSSGNERDAPMD
jgi:hypothetical protein